MSEADPARPRFGWGQIACVAIAFIPGYLANLAAESYGLAGWTRTLVVCAVLFGALLICGAVADRRRGSRA